MTDDVHRSELRAQTVEELRSFLDGTDLDLGCRPAVRRGSGELMIDVYLELYRRVWTVFPAAVARSGGRYPRGLRRPDRLLPCRSEAIDSGERAKRIAKIDSTVVYKSRVIPHAATL